MSVVTPVGIEDSSRALARRMVIGPAVVFALATVAVVVGLIVFAQNTSTVLRLYFAALGLFIGIQAVRNVAAYAFGDQDASLHRRGRTPHVRSQNWPSELFELESRISLAKVSAFDYQSRLRPVLRELAAQRLAARWNIDLATQPAAARAHVRDALWAELDGAPSDGRDLRLAPGPSTAKIRELIRALEAI